MDVTSRNRTELKSYFVKNSIPTESNFAELIEGMLNQKDDGLVKLPDNPLSIEAAGDEASSKNAINLYRTFNDANPEWSINLNPRSDPNQAGTACRGFNISDGEGKNRLFIDRSSGQLGIGTTNPTTLLQVEGTGPQLAEFRQSASSGADASIKIRGSRGGYPQGDIAAIDLSNYDSNEGQGGSDYIMARISGGMQDNAGQTGYLRFYTSSGVDGLTERLRIDKNGNVGLGTTAPQELLHINGSVRGNQSGALRISTGVGYVDLGPQNEAWAHFSTDRGKFYFNKEVRVDSGNIGSYDDNLSLQTEGTTRLTILKSNGNVGIGTTEPGASKLKVANSATDFTDISFAAAGSGQLELVGWAEGWNINAKSDGKHLHINRDAGESSNVKIGRSGKELFVRGSDGNVGIGTTEPQELLHVNGSVRGNQSGALRISTGVGYVDVGPKDSDWSHFYTDRTKYYFDKEVRVDTGLIGSYNENLSLRTEGTTHLTILKSNGNVGIGTTTPGAKLDLHGALQFNSNADQQVYGALKAQRNTVVLDGHWGELEVKGRVIDWTSSNLHIGFDNNHADHYIELGRKVGHIQFLSGGGETETMRITGGNVGIGTTNPGAKLDVNGDIQTNVGLISDNPHGTGYVSFSHRNQGTSGGYALLQHEGGETFLNAPTGKNINFRINNDTKMFLASSGRIGIGTTSPEVPLHIMGHRKVKGDKFRSGASNFDQHWSIGCYEWVGAEGYKSWSDARVKMNPQTLNPKEALAIISQLNLLDYQHIPTYQGGQKGRGVYAQQLKEIMPEAISTFPEMVLDDDTVIKDFLSVDYDWIFVTGMAAIQELNEQNKQLRQAVEDLQQQVEKNLEEKIIF